MLEVLPRDTRSVPLSFWEMRSVLVVWSSVFIPSTTVWFVLLTLEEDGLYAHE